MALTLQHGVRPAKVCYNYSHFFFLYTCLVMTYVMTFGLGSDRASDSPSARPRLGLGQDQVHAVAMPLTRSRPRASQG